MRRLSQTGLSTILRHIQRTGCTLAGDRVWTLEERAILRGLYPCYDQLGVHLPGRTRGAITHKARALGLVPPRRIWSEQDAWRLRAPYGAGVPIGALVEAFPGKSRRQIWNKAHALRVRRPRRAPKTTGLALVDAVRARAFACRLTMTDLDAFVGRRRYFVSPRHMDWRAVEKAIAVLGGTIAVQPSTIQPSAMPSGGRCMPDGD